MKPTEDKNDGTSRKQQAPTEAPASRSCVRTDDGDVHCGVVVELPESPAAPTPSTHPTPATEKPEQ
jgi:hypothetical protein